MDRLRLYLENSPVAIDGHTAGLLGDERERIGFIEEPQLAVGVGRSRRVEKNTSFEQSPVEVCDERADIAQAVLAA